MGTGLLPPANAEDEETPVAVIAGAVDVAAAVVDVTAAVVNVAAAVVDVAAAVVVVVVGIKLRRFGLQKIWWRAASTGVDDSLLQPPLSANRSITQPNKQNNPKSEEKI